MLETDAASAMLDWEVKISTAIVKETDGLDDLSADVSLLPRLKAVRGSMPSIGNWAAGKYVQPEDRIALRDKLLERFKTILGGDPSLPKAVEMDK